MRKLTQAILCFVTTSLIGYDAYVYRNSGTNATISAVVRDLAVEWPVAAVAIGTVIGHLFWPLTPRKDPCS